MVLVRYDAKEDHLLTDVSQKRMILKRRYYLRQSYPPLPLLPCIFFPPDLCSVYTLLAWYTGSLFPYFLTCSFMLCRYYLVEKAKDANIVGILVGTLGVGILPCLLELFYFVKDSLVFPMLHIIVLKMEPWVVRIWIMHNLLIWF